MLRYLHFLVLHLLAKHKLIVADSQLLTLVNLLHHLLIALDSTDAFFHLSFAFDLLHSFVGFIV
jgi:hypothetical protein